MTCPPPANTGPAIDSRYLPHRGRLTDLRAGAADLADVAVVQLLRLGRLLQLGLLSDGGADAGPRALPGAGALGGRMRLLLHVQRGRVVQRRIIPAVVCTDTETRGVS